jgi:hypothetical protein
MQLKLHNSMHDFISRAFSFQQITNLCLFDLSASLDMMNNAILVDRESHCFNLKDFVLSQIKSCLSKQSFQDYLQWL